MKKQLIIVLSCGLLLAPVAAAGVEATYHRTRPAEITTYKGGPLDKADYALARTEAEYLGHLKRQPKQVFHPSNPLVRVSGGKVLVEAAADGDPARLFNDLQGQGLKRGNRYGARISGWLPLGRLKKVLATPGLKSISASLKPMTRAGLVTSEGDIAMQSDLARTDYGVYGSGVTVGVLSDSYNALHEAADDQVNDDLPYGVSVLADYSGGTDEGRAMLQIVHDVAPGADLSFHTAFNGMADFADGIVNLAQAGADIIVDDVIYFAEPMFQDGIVAQAVDRVVNDYNAAYFSAAGNQARDSYESSFVSSGEHLQVATIFGGTEDRGVLHDFDPAGSVDFKQGITIPDQGQVIVALQWDAPFGDSPNDLDIYLVSDDMVIWAESISDNIAGGDPVEVLQFTNNLGGIFGTSSTHFDLLITNFAGPDAGRMKYVIFKSAGVTVQEYATNSSTLYGHANAAGAEAVGAAFYQDTPPFGQTPPLLEYFSSAGGTPILFDQDGNPVYDLRSKPGVVAPDGVNTTFFYVDSSRDADSWPNFFGTSAAAPHAGAVAALLRSYDATLSPAEIYLTLEASAEDMNTPGFDYDSGYGLIRADRALASLGEPPQPPAPQLIPPSAFFSYSCRGQSCSFDGSGSTDDTGIVSYAWDFGDGGTANGSTATHTYASSGNYTVTLTVIDNDGESDTATAAIQIKRKGASSGTSDSSGGTTPEEPPSDFCAKHPTNPKCP